MSEPNAAGPPVVDQSNTLKEQLSSAEGVFVGLDFDGTLAPIAEDPEVPTLSERIEELLEKLVRHQNVGVAVISGRELEDLLDRVGVDDIIYAGNHGLEVYRDGVYTVRGDAEEYEPLLESVADTLSRSVADVPGCRIEHKGVTLSVHVRQTPSNRVDDIRRVIESEVNDSSTLELTRGKQVFELRPAVSVDKGDTLTMLSEEMPQDWLTLYLGDDTTDEDAFEAIQPEGVGIHIGSNPETSAQYRIPTQQRVPAFLDWLVTVVSKEGNRS